MSASQVSRDGSPVAIYLARPVDDAPTLVHDAIGDGASILELGSGPGRLTRVLVAYGHDVTAVDHSEEMLAHVTGARTVCADLLDLDLGVRFDAVVVASHLINDADRVVHRRLLAVCRRHVAERGVVLVERFEPGWVTSAQRSVGRVGPVETVFDPGELVGEVRAAAVTYRLGSTNWVQRFTCRDVSDADPDEVAKANQLQVAAKLNDAGTGLLLRPTAEP
jgi:SAM-dependent methyltransferase